MILEYIQLLETTEVEQCFYNYEKDGKFCALGIGRDFLPDRFPDLLEELAKYTKYSIIDLILCHINWKIHEKYTCC